MDWLLYLVGLALVKTLQALPLRGVARLGRAAGGLAYWLDGRHRRVALANLAAALAGERSSAELRALAREHFKRLGENYACAVKTAVLPPQAVRRCMDVAGADRFDGGPGDQRSRIVAIGHFGNFELYARANLAVSGYQFATTYRAPRQPRLDRLLGDLRRASGCLVFERRRDGEALRAALRQQRLLLGLLSDQHAGHSGAWIPFFGRPCSTTTAPAVLAQRYKLPLHTAICYRVGPARWRIEVGGEIPVEEHGQRRPVADVMTDVNRAFEAAVRRDPANWFWVHNRWKTSRSRAAARMPGAAAEIRNPKSETRNKSE